MVVGYFTSFAGVMLLFAYAPEWGKNGPWPLLLLLGASAMQGLLMFALAVYCVSLDPHLRREERENGYLAFFFLNVGAALWFYFYRWLRHG